MTLSIERDLQNLCSFQRGELAAVATYEQALEAVQDPDSKRILLNCLRSHADRAKTLENRISQLGGTPAESAGPWGAMAKALEATARAKVEQCEHHRQHDGRRLRHQREQMERRGRDVPARAASRRAAP